MIVENMDDHAWVVPDDEVEPFDESMLIEFCYQVFATPDEVKDFAAGLCAAVTPVIDTVGRYQLGRVSLTSVENGQHDERHSASRRQRNPGQMLFDVTFAVRGRGDRNWLGHAIFHAVDAATLDWEQMTEHYYQGPHLQEALGRYPQLATTSQ